MLVCLVRSNQIRMLVYVCVWLGQNQIGMLVHVSLLG